MKILFLTKMMFHVYNKTSFFSFFLVNIFIFPLEYI